MATKATEFRIFTEAEKRKIPIWISSRLDAYRLRSVKGQQRLQVQRSGFKVDTPETPLDLAAYTAWLKGRVSNVGTLMDFLKSQEGWVDAFEQDVRIYQSLSETAALHLDLNATRSAIVKMEDENRLLRECQTLMQRANVASIESLKIHLEANNKIRAALKRQEASQEEKLVQRKLKIDQRKI